MSRNPVMRACNKWSRRLHRWGAVASALPLLIVICTGVLLLLKKQIDWIQPPERTASGGPPIVAFDDLLRAAAAAQGPAVDGWEDIDRIDVRIEDGVAKLLTHDRWELQVDTATGELLQAAIRRSDLIESLHDGSFFHPAAKLGVFLPSALLLLSLWTTGVYLWALPYIARTLRARRDRRAAG